MPDDNKDSAAGIGRRHTTERKTEKVDWQHHWVHWTVIVRNCLAVTKSCFTEQNCSI